MLRQPAPVSEIRLPANRLLRRRFVATRRHTMQVDFDRYLDDLARETRAGKNRSGKQRVACP